MRIFGICTALIMMGCALRLSFLMPKGPGRFLFRALFVIGGGTLIYASMRPAEPNPWPSLMASITILSSIRQAKRMRTNDPAGVLSFRPGSKRRPQMEVKGLEKTGP